jgi:HD superfamily phosphohydrolase
VILRDPVHGLISFEGDLEGVVVSLLDAREVQRLRRIRALGPAALAFPGAEHSRFAHAVGSAYVMKRYLDRVRQLGADIPAPDRIDDDTARMALAAAVLHDLGHGPYSHTFETLRPAARNHEDWTSMILLDPDTEVHGILREVDTDLPRQVERLIHGESSIPHLARAVSGTFDVDRCDYLMRDSHMTGVRYGLVDLDWLLASLRLFRPQGASHAELAVDGEKGLTAVEGFFLGRLHMYRQVYLHKAVRAAEVVIQTLFRRLCEVGPQPGTPPALQASLRGEPISTEAYLHLDDHVLYTALAAHAEGEDPVLRDLASRIRDRRLFKTLSLQPDASENEVRGRLEQLLDDAGIRPTYLGVVDRVEIDAYAEDDALVVVRGGQAERLLDASPLLRGLSRETFVHYRAIFPPEIREAAREALADLSILSPEGSA